MKSPCKRCRITAKATPGYENRFEIGKARVPDPYEPGKTLAVQINVRHDVLTHWRSRRSIDDAQFAAGRHLQSIWQRAGIGAPGAIQYDKPIVDGAIPGDTFTEKMIGANRELAEIARELGKIDYTLVRRIVCEGASIRHFASNKAEREYLSKRVREALGILACYWGATGKNHTRIRVAIYTPAA